MGKSPGKWVKNVHFGKKTPKSNLSQDDTSYKNTSITINSHSDELSPDSVVISSPMYHEINVNEKHTQLEKRSSPKSLHYHAAVDDELIKLHKAATKVQAAFKGYLTRRAFWELKGIIRIQALIRGHLVRRHANVRANLLQKTSLKSEKLSTNASGVKELEQDLGGVVLKNEVVETVVEQKEYTDKRDKEGSVLGLTKATITRVERSGMGDRVCVDLCSLMKPGEGLLVGSFARGLFLVHSECLESSNYNFRVNAGPVHAYVAIPGGKTCYLSELKAGKEVLVVDQNGIQRTAVIGRVKIETRPLIIVDAKVDSDEETYSILLHNLETVGLVPPNTGGGNEGTTIGVTSLKVGDEVLVRVQGGGRHTGVEIQEFLLEK